MTENKILEHIKLLPDLSRDPKKEMRYLDYRNVLASYYNSYLQRADTTLDVLNWQFFHDRFVEKLNLIGARFILNNTPEACDINTKSIPVGRRKSIYDSGYKIAEAF